MESTVLQAVGIQKKYSGNLLLSGVDLTVCKGEAVALVGENGCGKSTLIRVLAGLTKPSGGYTKMPPHIRPGLIPDRFEKINMTVSRFMRHMLALENTSGDSLDRYYREFSLESMLDTPMKYLSKGTLQKVAVIQALLCERDILFMDEPLSGQDAASQAFFAEEIRIRKQKGMAVVLACHEPYLVLELADRILKLEDGRLTDGAAYVFRGRRAKCRFFVECAAGLPEPVQSMDMNVRQFGQMYRIEADQALAKELFSLFLAANVHIVKYEENEELC